MNYAAIIRQVGRGREGARSIGRVDACALFGDMLDGKVPDVHLGALLLAYRIKGETSDELAGFLDAVRQRVAPIAAPRGARCVVLPTYNGARTSPNLVPLLALTLAGRGIPVLVHGVAADPSRVTTAEIFTALGVAHCADGAAAGHALAVDRLAFLPIERLAPGLAGLLELRWTLGVRNSAHTVAKMLAPVDDALLLVSVTHPEYLVAMRSYYATLPADVLLLRGTQGEAVANARRAQAVEWLHEDGSAETVIAGDEGTIATLPELPAIDAASTAAWIRGVLDGVHPLPAAIERQAEVIERIATRAAATQVCAA